MTQVKLMKESKRESKAATRVDFQLMYQYQIFC